MTKHQWKKYLIALGSAILSVSFIVPIAVSCSASAQQPNDQNRPLLPGTPIPPGGGVNPPITPENPEGEKPPVTPENPESENKPPVPPTTPEGETTPPVTPPKPPISGGSGGTYFHKWGHSGPNPNYENDKGNSFLISPTGQTQGAGYHPSPGVPQYAKLESWKFTNQQQVKNSQKTFAITIGFAHYGTGWILDYKIPDGVDETQEGFKYTDENYPTTWYIASNAHVFDDFVDGKPNDPGILYPNPETDHVGNKIDRTSSVSLQFVENPQIGEANRVLETAPLSVNNTYRTDGGRYEVTDTNVSMRRVYVGNDFLTTSPNQFNQAARFASGMQEYADFAVLEVTFLPYQQTKKDTTTQQVTTQTLASAGQWAKFATQNYANLPANEKFTYKKTDLLNEKSQLNGGFNIVGYPGSQSTGRNLFVNRPAGDTTTNSSPLSTSPNYTTFGDTYPGIMDGIIGMGGWFGYTYKSTETTYATWGLIYPSDYGSLSGGSSGSLVTDDSGVAWGIHFAGDDVASTGLAQAFYSKGFDYQGYYGAYNLPAYDLIAGEPESEQFPLQKTSYRANLVKLYGNQNQPYRTNLFPQGINNAIYK